MKLMGKGWRALVLVAVAAACKDDGGGTGSRVATTLTATSPATQTAVAGTAVATAPAVRVLDQAGAPLPGVVVTFTASSGGSVGSPTATTDAAGNASAGSWTLGAALGPQTLTATVPSLTPVQFTATATDPCDSSVTFTLGSTASASLSAADCRLGSGEYIDFYAVNLPTAQAVSFNLSSTAFDTWLEMYDVGGNVVAVNDDASASTANSAVRVFAPSGSYFLAATSFNAGATGAYQLTSSGLAGNVNCDEYWVVPGVSITGTLTATDCDFGGYLADDYSVVLRPGQTLTVRLESAAFDAYLALYDAADALVVANDDGAGGTNSLLTYTHTGTGPAVFLIDASTFDPGESGAYTLIVTRS